MARLRIKARGFATAISLEVTDAGVVWYESALFSSKKRIAFADIGAVLRGPATLSLQVGRTVHTIPVKQENAEHRAVIARLVSECRRTVPRRRPPAVPPLPALEEVP